MSISPVLALHICSGTVGFLSGATAIFLRKGSRNHRVVGNVFVVSMLALAATGTYMALVKWQPGNILGGTLTFYLVGTGWMTARRREERTGILDWVAFLAASLMGTAAVARGLEIVSNQTGMKHDPAGGYFFLGSIALLCAAGDLRILVNGGISTARHLARHLWRMCFALFIASGSIFLARPHLFPVFLRKSGALFVLSFFPLVLMIFWLIRVRMTGARPRKPLPAVGGDVPSLAA